MRNTPQYDLAWRVLGVVLSILVLDGCMKVDVEKTPPEQLFQNADVLTLVKAAGQGDVETIDRLVERGVDVNSRGRGGATPLLKAFFSKNREGYLALLRHGANPNLLDDTGKAVANQAVEEKDPFWLAEALKHGANPNLVNEGNRFYPNSTPIFYAIDAGRYANVKLLIEAGADLDHQEEKFGNSPLMQASQTANYDIVLMLLEAGADFRIPDKHGRDLIKYWYRGRDENMVPKSQKEWFRKVQEFFKAKGIDLS